jgi:cytochrome c oxidase subunit 1
MGHLVATVGSWFLALGLLIFLGNFVVALFRGEKAADNPWGGVTLEWQIPSPPPTENFEEIPTVTHGPYEFAESGKEGRA